MKNKTFEEVLNDKNIIKISNAAARKFCPPLSKDEVYTCIINAVWRAYRRYNEEYHTKFTTYLYSGVVMECLTQIKFNKYHSCNFVHRIDRASKISRNEINVMEEIESCEDPDLIYDRFILNKSIKEIAAERGVCGETIRLKIKKTLKNMKEETYLCV